MSKLKGLVPGGESTSHASGNDITYTVLDTGKKVRIEGDEYHMCGSALLHDEILEFKNMTSHEVLDEIYTRHKCSTVPGEAMAGDFIICKPAVRNPEKRSWTGTVKEIINIMQSEYGCRVSGASHDKMNEGGKIAMKEAMSERGIAEKHGLSEDYIKQQAEYGTDAEMEEHGCDRDTAYALTLHHLEINPKCYECGETDYTGMSVEEICSAEGINPQEVYPLFSEIPEMSAGGAIAVQLFPKVVEREAAHLACITKMYRKYGKKVGSFSDFVKLMKSKDYHSEYWKNHFECMKQYAKKTGEMATSLMESGGSPGSIQTIGAYRHYTGTDAFVPTENPANKYGSGVYFCTLPGRYAGKNKNTVFVEIEPVNPIVFEEAGMPNLNYVKEMRKAGFSLPADFTAYLFSVGHDALVVKHPAAFGDEIILAGPSGCVKSVTVPGEIMEKGGTTGKTGFDKKDIPSRRIYDYTQILKSNYPAVWAMGGNIFGNKAYRNLERVLERGYWLESEEWMYKKWKSFQARHAGDFLIRGIIANLKWMVWPARGAEYCKEVIREEVLKKYPGKEPLLENGGTVDGDTQERITYRVLMGNDDFTDMVGTEHEDYEDALYHYGRISAGDFGRYENSSTNFKKIEKVIRKYRFSGSLEEGESIEDYPLPDYYEDHRFYETVSEEYEDVVYDRVAAVNEAADELLEEVRRALGATGGYRTIYLDEEGDTKLTLRVKDHSGKRNNKSGDFFLSIVVTDKNPTKHFWAAGAEGLSQEDEEFIFDSSSTADEIVDFVHERIRYIQDQEGITDYEVKLAEGGYVGGETVTMNVPLLMRVFEQVREDVKSDEELHFVVERILDISGKGTLTMSDYEYIKGQMDEKPALRDAAAGYGLPVLEMAKGGTVNKYAVCTASLGRKYGMQRSLWDSETTGKYERCLTSVEEKMEMGGRLSKEAYEGKREWAAKKMAENRNIESMTEEQHDAMANLASVRHDFHVNMGKIIFDDEMNQRNKLIEANALLMESGLPRMDFIPVSLEDYIDIDTIDLLKQIEDVPEDENELQIWTDENYERIYSELSELHGRIESYMSDIDSKYGTSYAPSGHTRIMAKGGELSGKNYTEEIKKYWELAYSGKNLQEISKEIGVEDEYDDFSVAFAESELNGKRIPEKAKVFVAVEKQFQEINLMMVPTEVKKIKDNSDAGIIRVLKRIASRDEIRVNMSGVYFDAKNKAAVATDAMAMVWIKHPGIKKSRLVDFNDKPISADFPDWKRVWDYAADNFRYTVEVDLQYLLDTVGTVDRSGYYISNVPFIRIEHAGNDYYMNTHVLFPVIKSMAEYGCKKVLVRFSAPQKAIIIESISGMVNGLVMPMYLNDGRQYEYGGVYTILKDGKKTKELKEVTAEPSADEVKEFMEVLTMLSESSDTDAAELLETLKIVYG
jgi:hypothetical protein